jgi:hypothetical protein
MHRGSLPTHAWISERGLGKLTPIEFETIFEVAHAA